MPEAKLVGEQWEVSYKCGHTQVFICQPGSGGPKQPDIEQISKRECCICKDSKPLRGEQTVPWN